MNATAMSHYELLGVDRDATEEDIRRAFRRLAKNYHPDTNPSEAAAAMYLRLTEASDVLADPVRRADYNRTLDTPPAPTPAPAPAPAPAPESVADPDWGEEEVVDLDEDETTDDADVDFDIVDAPTDPGQWARPPVGRDALRSTAAQRRTWWQVTVVIAVFGTAFFAFAVYGTTRVMPMGVRDWSDGGLIAGGYATMAAVTATFVRPLRKLIIAVLFLAAVIATIVGWQGWTAGDVHLPLHPAILTWLGLALAVTLSRAWRLHKGRNLHEDEEVGADG